MRVALGVALGVALVMGPGSALEGVAITESWGEGTAEARSKRASRRAGARKRTRRSAKKRSKQVNSRRVCRRVKGNRRCRQGPVLAGHGVAKSSLRTEPLPNPSGEIWLYAVNFREELEVNIYGEDGDFDDEALAQLDNIFRCRRSRLTRAVDPRLYEIFSTIYDHFGRKRIELISGFRKKGDDESSRHFHASAMDIRIPGVDTQTLYEYAASLDSGGMGVGRYPVSKFVHVDLRAPGAKSYRWVDYSPPEHKKDSWQIRAKPYAKSRRPYRRPYRRRRP